MAIPTISIRNKGFFWPFSTNSLSKRFRNLESNPKLLNCKHNFMLSSSKTQLDVKLTNHYHHPPLLNLILRSTLSTSALCCGGKSNRNLGLEDDYVCGSDCDVDSSVQVPLIYGKRRRYSPVVQRMEGVSGNSGTSTLTSFFGSRAMNPPITVCVEGNIGSGKTTFLKHFKKFPDVCVFDEPISKWRDCQGYNLLDLMYKDPRKWSLCFQSYVQLTMLDLHTKPIVEPIKMMERSIFSAQYCFVQNLRNEGLIEDAQYAVLSEWFNFSTANLPIKLDLIGT
ncbi:unnamed protein product [Orchesella dallaii]|uniref:Deoxynucleoside kinase domain-containing protein n=1 Tax=Orchesella dallaii TaxID=48710 RepID=A0ABP1QJ37_9HEXA